MAKRYHHVVTRTVAEWDVGDAMTDATAHQLDMQLIGHLAKGYEVYHAVPTGRVVTWLLRKEIVGG